MSYLEVQGHEKKGGRRLRRARVDGSGSAPRAMRKSRARLIQKIYYVDPLLCPRCKGIMNVIHFIEETDVIRKILVHLSLWDIRTHDPPVKTHAHIPELTYNDEYSQLQFSDAWA